VPTTHGVIAFRCIEAISLVGDSFLSAAPIAKQSTSGSHPHPRV
jgi:hypothetical protein